ncbi:hypothetical protein Tco_0250624 [Tanacetum coccineum]
MPTYQTIHLNEAQNEEEMWLNLDLSQERRETTAIREAKYKKKVELYYNKRVRPISFKVGDFVYRKNAACRVENLGKLGLNWEGPYRVIEAYDNGLYKLATMDDREAEAYVTPPGKETQGDKWDGTRLTNGHRGRGDDSVCGSVEVVEYRAEQRRWERLSRQQWSEAYHVEYL